MASTALLTDQYELTMLRPALGDGAATRDVFEPFARRLPTGRRYGVVAGTGRLLDALESFPVRARRAVRALESGAGRRGRWTGWPSGGSPATSAATREGEVFVPG